MYQGNRISGKALEGLLQAAGAARKPADGAGKGLSPEAEDLFRHILDLGFNDAKNSFEKYYLEFQLSKNCGIISKTAEAIGIYPSNLHAKIKKHGILSGAGRNQGCAGNSGEKL
jgi:two-component system nitrogen regulation response regulator NtrX